LTSSDSKAIQLQVWLTENEIAELDKEISDFSNAAHALAQKLSEAADTDLADSELENLRSSEKVLLIHVRDGNLRTGKSSESSFFYSIDGIEVIF